LRANVAFVRRGTDAQQVMRELEPDAAIDEVKAVDGAILWATRLDSLNRRVMRKLIGGAAYKDLTVRNLNTTLKLQELLALRTRVVAVVKRWDCPMRRASSRNRGWSHLGCANRVAPALLVAGLI
jgi:hypothetical protein